ncbi:MAG: family 20 glycosylhydrolase [Ignavibacteriae bacterium]|nr:family 20 glycosylhydrolase [Ignavibacteriota bacterium]
MKKIIFVIGISLVFISCQTNTKKDVSIIPEPKSVEVQNGEFIINDETKLIYDNEFGNIDNILTYVNNHLTKSSGAEIKTAVGSNVNENSIYFKFDKNITNEEGYQLQSNTDGITISASSNIGIFYGVQTLLQLLPTEIFSQSKIDFDLIIPCINISDEPRFKYRGVHLDVGRHFFTKEDIKKYIDYLAMHKINKFHWHLTEDQGWRIEIKKYPKLTEIGAWRKESMGDEKPHGGFYTQEDVKEIVKYAQDRFITIIPEIEMPGHSQAALAAYPELSCTGGPFEVGTVWGVIKEVYCAGNENTFEFLEDVLTEVIELFPSEYIHIGGDECPKERWHECKKCQSRIKRENLKDEHELQSYFITRIENFLLTKGKKIIGWDEILEGGLAPQATVMSWRGIEGGIAAAKQNHDVIMTPGSHCYFDHFQGDAANEPHAFGSKLTLSKVYSYEPIPEELSQDEGKYILGAQANLWTEQLPEFKNVEYMLLPRIAALSEVVWTTKDKKDLENFIKKMDKQFERYEFLKVNYAKSAYNVNIGTEFNETSKTLMVAMSAEISNVNIFYTNDGSEPNDKSIKYISPFIIEESTKIKAVSYKNKNLMSKTTEKDIKIHKAFGKNITLKFPYSEKYTGGGKYALVDGLNGTNSFADSFWQGFEGDDLDAIIDLGNSTKISSVEMNFNQNNHSWVFLPEFVEISFSKDGVNFNKPIKILNDIDPKYAGSIKKKFTSQFNIVEVNYIKVYAKNIGKCPEWHSGAGGKAWIFIDEVTVN